MSLTPGTKLRPYEFVSPLGAGGMGEVCKARDTRLARDVAVVSADEVAQLALTFDRNNDGRLTRDELSERFQGMFERADANRDHSLTFHELRTLAAAQAPPVEQGPGRRRGGRSE